MALLEDTISPILILVINDSRYSRDNTQLFGFEQSEPLPKCIEGNHPKLASLYFLKARIFKYHLKCDSVRILVWLCVFVFQSGLSSCVLSFSCLLLSSMCSVFFPLPPSCHLPRSRLYLVHTTVIYSHFLATYKPRCCRPWLSVRTVIWAGSLMQQWNVLWVTCFSFLSHSASNPACLLSGRWSTETRLWCVLPSCVGPWDPRYQDCLLPGYILSISPLYVHGVQWHLRGN